MRWLLSDLALKCHVVGLGGIALFSLLLIVGDGVTPPEHYRIALFVWCAAYPALLFLIWLVHRQERQEAERERQQPTPALQKRRRRQCWRAASLMFCFSVGLGLCYLGLQGWEVEGLPGMALFSASGFSNAK